RLRRLVGGPGGEHAVGEAGGVAGRPGAGGDGRARLLVVAPPARRLMPFLRRLWEAGGKLLARETMVATNAIAFNFLLCLFPLLLVVVAALQAMPARRV